MTGINERALEDRARKLARKHGFLLRKSRAAFSADNLGDFMLIDAELNAIVAGASFDLSAQDVIALLGE
jgi:hypothetical protein